jgi:MFS family permease
MPSAEGHGRADSFMSVPNPFRTLRHRNFRLFWVGQTLSLIGTWMQAMATGWLALELSDSSFLVGLVASASSLPILLFSLHGGVVADRVNRLNAVRVCQTLLAIQAGILWWFTWSGHITISWLIGLAAVNGFIGAFEIPARQALVIELVDRTELSGAIALNSSGFNLARVVGPGIGAVVIAKAGIAACFGLNAISYIAVLIGLFMVTLPPRTEIIARVKPMEGIKELLHFMRDERSVNALMKVVTVFSVLGIPYLTLMPVVARQVLHLGAGGYGLLLACVGVGGLFGALGVAALADRFPRGKLLGTASMLFATLLIAFAFSRNVAIACAVLLATGFAMIVNNAVSNAMLQHLVPDHMRGRLMAAYSLVVVGISQVFGSFAAGALAESFGVPVAIGGTAAVMLAYSWYAFFRRPELRAL